MKCMKKVLFITAFTPSDVSASEKNTRILLEDLASSFDVDLIFSRYKGDVEYKPVASNIKTVKTFNNSKLIKVFNVLMFPILFPFFTVRFNFFRLRKIQKIVDAGKYGAIVFEHNQCILFAKFIKFDGPKLLYCHDVLYQKISRAYNKLIANFCRWSEDYCFRVKGASIYAISQKDCDLIKNLYGVDSRPALAYIEPQIMAAKPEKILENEYVFLANWARADNSDGLVWFFEKVVPLIDFPAKISIIGKHLHYQYDGSNPNVTVDYMGFVSNPYPYVSNCRAFLSPLFTGAGVKQKVFEALACGVPVIGNEIAFEGIDTSFSKYMFRFENEGDFVQCMRREVPMAERLKLKEEFTKSYHSKTIPMYIEELVNSSK